MKPGYKQTEVGVIPEDWEVSTIGDEFTIQLGKMLDAEKNIGTPKPYVGNRSVQWGRVDVSDLSTVPLTPTDLNKFRLRRGDLLACEGGDVGRAAIWNEPIPECYYQKALHRLRAKSDFSVIFMLNLLFHYSQRGVFANYVTQTSIAHLPKDKFETIPIPRPTLAEQEAIAGALSDADALIDSLEQLIAKKRLLKQGAMQDLLTGKKRLPGFEGESGWQQTDVGKIPKDWKIHCLGDIGETLIGLTYTPGDVADSGILVLRSSNVQEGRLSFENNVFVNMTVSDRVVTREGDILICVRNGSRQLIGKCALVDKRTAGSAFGAFMSVFRSKHNQFVFLQFQSEIIRRQIGEILGATINQITSADMKRFQIPLPPTEAEQTAIAAILSDMDAEIAALEAKLAKARQVKQGMMQELLTGKTRLV